MFNTVLFFRNSNRSGIRVFRLLERPYDQRHMGIELHVSHWRQTVPRMCRKYLTQLDSMLRQTLFARGSQNLNLLLLLCNLSIRFLRYIEILDRAKESFDLILFLQSVLIFIYIKDVIICIFSLIFCACNRYRYLIFVYWMSFFKNTASLEEIILDIDFCRIHNVPWCIRHNKLISNCFCFRLI